MSLPFSSYEAIATQIKRSRLLSAALVPVARWFVNASGYRRLGLRYDDILMEENPNMQVALGRLPAAEQHARAYRHRRAMQLSLQHAELPREQWTKPEEDVPYLRPYLKEVETEMQDRTKYNNLVAK
ncbi:Cytochrome b-c1 complex subunit 7 [Sorochytrium milnesiophthora]